MTKLSHVSSAEVGTTTVSWPAVSTILFPSIAFVIPLVLAGPQLIVGTAVNCFLFLSATLFSKRKLLVIAVLPSIGATLHGVLFGSLTSSLLYFLPAIWIGNYLMMDVWGRLQKKGAVISLFSSALIKAIWLSVFAVLFVRLGIVPQPFLIAMSLFQLATALVGGSIALAIISYQSRP